MTHVADRQDIRDVRSPGLQHPARHLFVTAMAAIFVASCGAAASSGGSARDVVTPPVSTPSATPSAALASAPAVSARPESRVTLRVATVEPGDSAEGKAIDFFRDDVARRSGGSIVVKPESEAGESDQGNIGRLAAGDIEMTIVQARNWDEFGVTSMQALQTPFLIATDALAAAATTGDLATDLMSGLRSRNVEGLALWPIDLRHPVSFGAPLLSPADFDGAKIRIVGSTINKQVIRALGGEPVSNYDDSVKGGESAYDRAYSLPGPGTFSGNVTLYPRVDVFVIAGASLARLSDTQQGAIRAAANATRDHVVSEIVPDQDQAKAYCLDQGGAVVLASDAQLTAFKKALRPVGAMIAADKLNARIIASIRALGTTLPPTEPVAPCGKPAK